MTQNNVTKWYVSAVLSQVPCGVHCVILMPQVQVQLRFQCLSTSCGEGLQRCKTAVVEALIH